MHTLNEYRLEFKGKKKEGYYKVFSVLSPIFFILSVVCIIPSFLVSLFFLFGFGVFFVLCIVLDIIAKQYVFTMEYCWNDGVFSVKRINIDGKETVCEEFDISDISTITLVDELGEGLNYTDQEADNDKFFVKIEVKKRDFYLSLDKYMYSLVCLGGRSDLLG